MRKVKALVSLALALTASAGVCAAAKVSPAVVCLGANKCVGSVWPLHVVERFYRVKRIEVYELAQAVCISQGSTYFLLTYDQRSRGGLRRPAALEVALEPSDICKTLPTKESNFDFRPSFLGDFESNIVETLGRPDEVWTSENSDQGIKSGERGLLYQGKDNDFVLIVVREGVVVRVLASSLP